MHWSIECNERLQEANLQVVKLKKLLNSELPCDKEIGAQAKLMQIKWDEFEKTHFKHRSIVSNGMRAIMDQVHHEAAAEHNAIAEKAEEQAAIAKKEALAQMNAKIAADETAARKAAEKEAIAAAAKKAEEAAARKAAENTAVAAATKMKADEEAATAKESTTDVPEATGKDDKPVEKSMDTEDVSLVIEPATEADATTTTKRRPLPLHVIAAAAAANKVTTIKMKTTLENEKDQVETPNKNDIDDLADEIVNTEVIEKAAAFKETFVKVKAAEEGLRLPRDDNPAAEAPVGDKYVYRKSARASQFARGNDKLAQYNAWGAKQPTQQESETFDLEQQGQLDNVKKRCGTLLTLGELGIGCIVRNDTDGSYGQDMEGLHSRQEKGKDKLPHVARQMAGVQHQLGDALTYYSRHDMPAKHFNKSDNSFNTVPAKPEFIKEGVRGNNLLEQPVIAKDSRLKLFLNKDVIKFDEVTVPVIKNSKLKVSEAMYREDCKADKRMWCPTYFKIGINYQPLMPNPRNLYWQGNKGKLLKQNTTSAKFPSVYDLYFINVSLVEEPEGLKSTNNYACTKEYGVREQVYGNKYREHEHGMCISLERMEIINKDSIEFKPPEVRRFILEQHANIVRNSVEDIGYGIAHNIGGFGLFVKPVHIIKDNAAAGFKQLAARPENVNLFGGRSNSEIDNPENEELTSSDRQTIMKPGQSAIDRVIAGVNQYG